MDDLTKKAIFGKVMSYLYVVGFQKRGLSHAHILLILEDKSKPKTINACILFLRIIRYFNAYHMRTIQS